MRTKALFFFVALLFAFTASNAQTTTSKKKTTALTSAHRASAFLNGAWQSTMGEQKAFSVMHDGFFNSVAQDSSGKWAEVHAGTYTVNGDNTITFNVQYSSIPDHVGFANTAEYTVSGETLKLRHYKKLVDAQGKDWADQMPKDAWETMTKAK
jgi:hypothetical protein